MAAEQRKIRWPDGASVSLPTSVGTIGGTYYWSPGSPTAPQFTLPSVTLNGTAPSSNNYLIPQPLKTRVTSVEAGIGLPMASAAITNTYSPQQIVDFLARHFPYVQPDDPPSDRVMVHDSAAAAGIPGRNNVFEYEFPESGSLPPRADTRATNADNSGRSVFVTGASPAPPLPPVLQNAPRGLPGLISESFIDPSNPAAPPAGGLAGLIQDYRATTAAIECRARSF